MTTAFPDTCAWKLATTRQKKLNRGRKVWKQTLQVVFLTCLSSKGDNFFIDSPARCRCAATGLSENVHTTTPCTNIAQGHRRFRMLNPQASTFSVGDSHSDLSQHYTDNVIRNMSPLTKGAMRVYVDAAANGGRESATVRVREPPLTIKNVSLQHYHSVCSSLQLVSVFRPPLCLASDILRTASR